MRYDMYLLATDEAAAVTGGAKEQLGGEYVGIKLPADGAYVMLVLDMDDEDGWSAWRELPDGSRCCDDCYLKLGFVRLDLLKETALHAVAQHRCS